MSAVPEPAKKPDLSRLYEIVFLCSPDAIALVDSAGKILSANPQLLRLFGYSRQELQDKPVELLIPERFRAAHARHLKTYALEPNTRPMGAGLELYALKKDGSEFSADVMLSPVETDRARFVVCVIRDVSVQKHIEDEMRHLVLDDPLTGLGNYRRLQEAFETETKWNQRVGRSFGLLLLDLDGLKRINDTHGHLVGSRALCRVADALRSECRAIDVAVRHGGDEFAVVLPDANAEGSESLARRVGGQLAINGGHEVPVTFSYGVASYPKDGKTLQQLLESADEGLYRMKKEKQEERSSGG
jgi:diguanylate cyclase (GGDEF)-like protein/PAS domain S-box-containing protein